MANLNKIKQYKELRQICMDRMADLRAIAESAKTSSDIHSHLRARYTHLNSIYQDFENYNASLIPLMINAETYDNDEHKALLQLFYQDYYDTKAIYDTIFDPDNTVQNIGTNNSHVKLPKIELIKFDGDLKQWKTFIDMFNSLVHENQSLRNIEKFNYLVTSLSGAPLTLVKCNPLSDQNYIVAYNSLLERYENKRLLAATHYHELENAQKIPDNLATSSNLRKLLDTYSENISALKNLKFPTDQWSFLLFNMLLRRLDSNTVSRFEMEFGSNDVPTYDALNDFVLKHCCALDRAADSFHKKPPKNEVKVRTPSQSFSTSHYTPKRSSFHVQTKSSCPLCTGDHLIYKCSQFLALSPRERHSVAKAHKWCVNCLGSMHAIRDCGSKTHCLKCGQPHHTLLHFFDTPSRSHSSQGQASYSSADRAAASSTAQSFAGNVSSSRFNIGSPNSSVQPITPVVSDNTSNIFQGNVNSHYCSTSDTTVLLSTAWIEVLDAVGNYQKVRALLDSGSQVSILSEACCARLGLRSDYTSLSIQGISSMSSTSTKAVSLQIRSCYNPQTTLQLKAVVLSKVCSHMPSHSLEFKSWSHISKLQLADPQFHIPAEIDILLGADIFSLALQTGRIVGNSNEPIALNTVFGWVLMGTVNCSPLTVSPLNSLHCSCEVPLDSAFKRFWEIEDIPRKLKNHPDDELAEENYISTLSRNSAGRFIVTLPFRSLAPTFSDSREISMRRFLSLERRLRLNPPLYKQYCDFMSDYLEQNHMSLTSQPETPAEAYYIPHHCIVRPESTTTKLRVVFDASAKTSNGTSLNDTLLTGPKLQNDLATILLRFRIHSVALMTDIRQMYRQILVADSHKTYQRILWRFSCDQPIEEYTLNTITYGVASAPFLAIRTLLQLAEIDGAMFPLAVEALKNCSYVDDIVTSCVSIDYARAVKSQLVSLLKQGGFELHKWKSNDPTLLSSDCASTSKSLDLEDGSTTKVLGLQWNPAPDVFTFSISAQNLQCTKRHILSDLARIFDPLGFLSPLTLFAKRLIQHLWTCGIGWDDHPPPDIIKVWSTFQSDLSVLMNLSVPRQLFHSDHASCALHGFSDASEKGYSAVIYSRVEVNAMVHVRLVCAKAKVSPLKTISIPRLELCGAALLSDLFTFVLKAFDQQIAIDEIFAWSDSSTTLDWIRSSPHRWKTFVSNRVSHIQERLPPNVWHYVPSKDNPADCSSRGLLPSQLVHHTLWWAGPSWLSQPAQFWPSSSTSKELGSEALAEEKKISLLVQQNENVLHGLLENHSSLPKIQRILSYVLRFINNSRLIKSQRSLYHLTSHETHQALQKIVKYVQSQEFSHELSNLENRKPLCKSLRKLDLFVDKDGLLRVGGRLVHSGLVYDKKHPLLLPSRHRLTDILIEMVHKQYLHPGIQTLHFILLQKFWILSAKRTIRRCLSRCLTCWRQHPAGVQPPMGNLPPLRVSQLKPFSCIGVDFGGPYTISLGRYRGAKVHKAYICLFVCFATKAVHVELASDLSTETFLAALRRFMSRRGRVSYIFSDNATNFVGASRMLMTLMQNAAQEEQIEWRFIPPSSPHFGGLWEAGIKSVKSHLCRMLGDQILTYEEFNTLLIRIEAVLNSRPICPISSDPNDLLALTPGHFLTLEPLNSPPDNDLSHLALNRLSRWQMIQRLHQDFWSRWSTEYLHTLLQRGKWTQPSANIEIGSMVLIKNDSLPSSRWLIGRITDVHPGTDGIVRVVTVRTTQGILKRPVVKICPLPLGSSV